MIYIAQKEETKELSYSKGANKIANLIGINPTTVTRNAKTTFSEKIYNGFRIAKCKPLDNKDRGNNIQDNKKPYYTE
jgi:hypothetical protein